MNLLEDCIHLNILLQLLPKDCLTMPRLSEIQFDNKWFLVLAWIPHILSNSKTGGWTGVEMTDPQRTWMSLGQGLEAYILVVQ